MTASSDSSAPLPADEIPAADRHYEPETFGPRDSIGYLVKQVQRLMTDRIESAFAAQSFTFQQWIVLMYLRDGIASTPAELCRETRHDSGAMTRLIDQLERRSLIRRERRADDRRVTELHLTDNGRAELRTLTPIVVNCLNEVLYGLSKSDVAAMKRVLHHMIGRLTDTRFCATAAPEPRRTTI